MDFTAYNFHEGWEWEKFEDESYDFSMDDHEKDIFKVIETFEKEQDAERKKKKEQKNKGSSQGNSGGDGQYKSSYGQGVGGAAPQIFFFDVNNLKSPYWVVLFFGIVLASIWFTVRKIDK